MLVPLRGHPGHKHRRSARPAAPGPCPVSVCVCVCVFPPPRLAPTHRPERTSSFSPTTGLGGAPGSDFPLTTTAAAGDRPLPRPRRGPNRASTRPSPHPAGPHVAAPSRGVTTFRFRSNFCSGEPAGRPGGGGGKDGGEGQDQALGPGCPSAPRSPPNPPAPSPAVSPRA